MALYSFSGTVLVDNHLIKGWLPMYKWFQFRTELTSFPEQVLSSCRCTIRPGWKVAESHGLIACSNQHAFFQHVLKQFSFASDAETASKHVQSIYHRVRFDVDPRTAARARLHPLWTVDGVVAIARDGRRGGGRRSQRIVDETCNFVIPFARLHA